MTRRLHVGCPDNDGHVTITVNGAVVLCGRLELGRFHACHCALGRASFRLDGRDVGIDELTLGAAAVTGVKSWLLCYDDGRAHLGVWVADSAEDAVLIAAHVLGDLDEDGLLAIDPFEAGVQWAATFQSEAGDDGRELSLADVAREARAAGLELFPDHEPCAQVFRHAVSVACSGELHDIFD